jgi:hypothetical protein
MEDEEQLSERITIRFTPSEISKIKRAMKADGLRKESAFIRRILILFLRDQAIKKLHPPEETGLTMGSTRSYRKPRIDVALVAEDPAPSGRSSARSRK